jgi:glutamate formiminotransferase / 5-formyltetrahydrofolate cyclo-ligase
MLPVTDQRLLAVPNVSDGSERGVMEHLREGFVSDPVVLLDEHSDAVHNRTVYTLAGDDAPLLRALKELAWLAIERIDISRQQGAHPRIGSIDVCPIVWPEPSLRARAHDVAMAVAEQLGSMGLPVFLYGELASTPERVERSFFRQGGHVELGRRMRDEGLEPDYGPGWIHPTAGGVLVTARAPLAAFNMVLEQGTDLETGQAVAAGLRESGGGLLGVRAIAIELAPGRVQISTNVHDPVAVPLAEVVAATRRLGSARGTAPVEGEIVGLVPEAALEGFPDDVPVAGGDPRTRTIESRLAGIPS